MLLEKAGVIQILIETQQNTFCLEPHGIILTVMTSLVNG